MCNGQIAKLAGRVTGPRMGQSLIMFLGNHLRSGAYLPVRDDTRESEGLRRHVIGNIITQNQNKTQNAIMRKNYAELCVIMQ